MYQKLYQPLGISERSDAMTTEGISTKPDFIFVFKNLVGLGALWKRRKKEKRKAYSEQVATFLYKA